MFQALKTPDSDYRRIDVDPNAALHFVEFLGDFPEISRFLSEAGDAGMASAKEAASDNALPP
jgi:hypothetical protein